MTSEETSQDRTVNGADQSKTNTTNHTSLRKYVALGVASFILVTLALAGIFTDKWAESAVWKAVAEIFKIAI